MGLGMVLAAGCPFRLITRTSEGDLNAMFAIVGFALGGVVFAHTLPRLQKIFIPLTFTNMIYLSDLLKLIR
jgi:uncharacterized membrane protein YedE/YeeE